MEKNKENQEKVWEVMQTLDYIRREINAVIQGDRKYDSLLDENLINFKNSISKLDVFDQATHDVLKNHWISVMWWVDFQKTDENSLSLLMSAMSTQGNICATDINKNGSCALNMSLGYQDIQNDEKIKLASMLIEYNSRNPSISRISSLDITSMNDCEANLDYIRHEFNLVNKGKKLDRSKIDLVFSELDSDNFVISSEIQNFAAIAASRVNFQKENSADLLYLFEKMYEKSASFDKVFSLAGSFKDYFPEYEITDTTIKSFKEELAFVLNEGNNKDNKMLSNLKKALKRNESENSIKDIMGYCRLPGKK